MSDAQIRNPATGETIAEQKTDSEDVFIQAVSRVRKAQQLWARCPVRERSRIVARLARAISERQHDLAQVISSCSGKTRTDALAGDIVPLSIAARWYARAGRRVMRTRRLRRGHIFFALIKKSYLVREPLGVIGIISPWNYPFGIPMHEIMMALVTGNGVVLKVATQAQPVGEAIIDLVRSVGVPEDLVALVHLPGRQAGDAFLGAAIDKLMFTGSVAVGKQLAEGAARRLLPVGLELGGNDAMIVLDDAPLDRAVSGALWAGLSNAGQSCGGVERVIVERGIWKQFRDALVERVSELRVGPDRDHNVDVGSLTTDAQRSVVEAHVRQALEAGARIAAESSEQAGGASDHTVGAHKVVVLENVSGSMDVLRHETFGPVLTLEQAENDDDAIDRANDSYLGLSGSVWSTNRRRAFRVAGRLEAGSIGINDHLMQHGMAETPWGGYKESSVGRTHGILGLESMTKPKVVVASRFKRAPHLLWWFPNSPKAYRAVGAIPRFLFGPGRLSAAATMLPAFIASLFTRPRRQ